MMHQQTDNNSKNCTFGILCPKIESIQSRQSFTIIELKIRLFL